MIGHLRGTILEKHPNEAIVEAGGVGYAVQIPISTYTTLPDAGSSVALRVHTHVREDALVLFGFATRLEQTVFERLISVSGIGPKLAITVLSGLATADLIGAIRSGDVAKLVRIPGVGKKTAERIVLELKEKLIGIGPPETPATAAPVAAHFSALEEDVLSALQNLGCSRAAAEQAIRKVAERGAPDDFESYFRAAMAQVR
ncbi:MAG TPA: Holliday junction branch migration protein RuvA [Bryobacteraceae bacterium]|jgi:Holliday junction DNA helicase RuvA|nr:Holliday junction branch migration protein RuvA [Bryobacteraceae bacterium]